MELILLNYVVIKHITKESITIMLKVFNQCLYNYIIYKDICSIIITPTWKKTYNPNNAALAIIGNIAASFWDIVSGFSPDACE